MKHLAFAALATHLPADLARGASPDAPVMEIVTFRLIEGADQKQFLAAAARTEAMLRDRGDLIRRFLTVDDTGLWTDLIEWRSQTAAKSAAAEVIKSPDFQPLMAMIDVETVTMRHAGILWRME